MNLSVEDHKAWAAYEAAGRRARLAYYRQPNLGHNAPYDPDVRSCKGCKHLTAHRPAWCAACRRELGIPTREVAVE